MKKIEKSQEIKYESLGVDQKVLWNVQMYNQRISHSESRGVAWRFKCKTKLDKKSDTGVFMNIECSSALQEVVSLANILPFS